MYVVLYHYKYNTAYAYAYGMINAWNINQHVCIHAFERVPVGIQYILLALPLLLSGPLSLACVQMLGTCVQEGE
jgi:hypothetical protein